MSEHKKIYRSRNGVFLGVCRGLARHLGVSVFWTRVVTFLLFLFTGIWPTLVAYVVLGIVLPLEPVRPFASEADEEFYDSYAHSRSMAIHRLKRVYDGLNRRIGRMEDLVTKSEYDWDRRLRDQR
jgi:phage shock protein C